MFVISLLSAWLYHVGTTTIAPVKIVRDLGVLLDSELTMQNHWSVLLSPSAPKEGSPNTGLGNYKTTGIGFYHQSPRLL